MTIIKDVVTKFDTSTKTKYFFLRISGNPFVYLANDTKKGNKPLVEIARENNFSVAINAGLFNPKPKTYNAEGVIITNGKVIQNKSAVFYPDSMPLTIDKNGKLWFANADADAEVLVKQGVVHAVCGFMPIIINHKEVPKDKWTNVPHYIQPHQRQIIGQFENGDYGIITCEGRGYANSKGWTIFEAQEVCKRHGLMFAYNLDGGTSTELVIRANQINCTYKRDISRFAPTFIVF